MIAPDYPHAPAGLVEHTRGTRRVRIRPFATLARSFAGADYTLPANTAGLLAVDWNTGAPAVLTAPLPGHFHLVRFITDAEKVVAWQPLVSEPGMEEELVQNAFGRDYFFRALTAPFSSNVENTWITVDDFTRTFEGGTYMVFFISSWRANQTAKSIGLRILLDGIVGSTPVLIESRDPGGLESWSTFTQATLPAGGHTLTYQVFQEPGGGTDLLQVEAYRLMGYRVA